MNDRMIRSGCEHDPSATSVDFCWQCRIAELKAENERLRQKLPARTMQVVCDIQRKRISDLKAHIAELEHMNYTLNEQSLGEKYRADQAEKRIAELEADKAEILRLWFEDADPAETQWCCKEGELR
jgi:TolA-binding protein